VKQAGQGLYSIAIPAMDGGYSDFIGIKKTDSSIVRGVGVIPLALGWSGILALLGGLLLAWLYESRRGRKA